MLAADEIHTTGVPAAIQLAADKDILQADARDAAHVTIKVVDAQGNVVPTAENEITVEVQGAGNLIGLDNGDPLNLEDYKGSQRKVLAGLALGILQSAKQAGEIRIHASANGLKDASLVLKSVAIANPPKPVFTPLEP